MALKFMLESLFALDLPDDMFATTASKKHNRRDSYLVASAEYGPLRRSWTLRPKHR
jgi:hypothetical protein